MSPFILTCLAALLVLLWHQARRSRKHDDVLFPFCQLRRDVMKFRFEAMTQSPTPLSREERESLRRLSRTLDDVIHNYSKHKKMMFNLRTVIAQMRKHQSALKEIEPLKLTNNTDIQNFYVRFGYCSAKAFIAYTPLIRSEFILCMFAFVTPGIWRISKSRAQQLMQDMKSVQKDKQRYAPTVGAAA